LTSCPDSETVSHLRLFVLERKHLLTAPNLLIELDEVIQLVGYYSVST
jgi:hypothetical protein